MSKQGWECPRCGVIHAPWVAKCHCATPSLTVSGTAAYMCYCPTDSAGNKLHESGCPLLSPRFGVAP